MIQETLQQPYDRARWTALLARVFPNVAIYETPQRSDETGALVQNFLQLGHIRLGDGKHLAIFEIRVTDKVQLAKNRSALRNLIASKIDLGTTHGVLCIFNSSEPTYRFTFVCKETSLDEGGHIVNLETNPRRFTYILGPGETRRTATERFQELAIKRDQASIREVIEAFSVERLNKEFFKLYKDHYQAFVSHLLSNTTIPSTIFGVNSLPGSKAYEADSKPVRDWVKKLLGRIVFIHFIQKKGWMGCSPSSKRWRDGDPQFLLNLFRLSTDEKKFYSKSLAPLFFEALNAPGRPGDIFEISGSRVPYLNGGLFEDGEPFAREIDFPPSLFKGLLEFFASYNFTIDENEPEEHEVGIDPEMLGHIFENLLEENKDKGAFYTPKTVVQFMSQQSLLLYLQNHLGEHEELETLVCQKNCGEPSKNNWVLKNVSRIQRLLEQVTICDPAIGSGAFPIGMLQEIFWTMLALQPAFNDPTKFADIKRRIIEHTIHGVDIDSGAVEIARLRCWLSLIVDEVEPRPLPNLEFKIHCADSLIEYIHGEPVNLSQHLVSGSNTQKVIGNLIKSKEALFKASRVPEKRAARLAFYKALTELAELEFVWMLSNQGLFEQVDRARELRATLGELKQLAKKLYASDKMIARDQEELLRKVSDWFGDKDKPTFAWRLHFGEVFSARGFDILIANPPYVQQESIVAIKPHLKSRYDVYTGQSDLYVYFIESGIKLLKPGGIFSYVTSNKYHRSRYGRVLRVLFKGNCPSRGWLISMISLFLTRSHIPAS